MVAKVALGGKLPLEIAHIVVLITKTFAAGETATVDDRGMIEFVRKNRRSGDADRRQQTFVCTPTRDVAQCRFRGKKFRDPRFELAVHVKCSTDEPHRRGPRSVAAQSFDPGIHDLGTIGQTQVVVAGEDEDVAGLFHPHVRRHRRREVT